MDCQRETILPAILHHDTEFDTYPVSPEEKVICDADSLEKVRDIGPLQGLRTFLEFGEGSHPEFRSLEKF